MVFSPQAYQRACKTIDKQCKKQSIAELKAFAKLCKKALMNLEKTLKLNFLSEVEISVIPRFKGKGRPAAERQLNWFDYRIEGAMVSNLLERTRRLQRKSCFILATNQLNHQALSHEELIAAYKDQQQFHVRFCESLKGEFLGATRPNN